MNDFERKLKNSIENVVEVNDSTQRDITVYDDETYNYEPNQTYSEFVIRVVSLESEGHFRFQFIVPFATEKPLSSVENSEKMLEVVDKVLSDMYTFKNLSRINPTLQETFDKDSAGIENPHSIYYTEHLVVEDGELRVHTN